MIEIHVGVDDRIGGTRIHEPEAEVLGGRKGAAVKADVEGHRQRIVGGEAAQGEWSGIERAVVGVRVIGEGKDISTAKTGDGGHGHAGGGRGLDGRIGTDARGFGVRDRACIRPAREREIVGGEQGVGLSRDATADDGDGQGREQETH